MRGVTKRWFIVGLIIFVPMLSHAGLQLDHQFDGMFDVYQDNRSAGTPNYITEDFIMLAYNMCVNEAIRELEEQVLMPSYTKFTASLLDALKQKDKNQVTQANRDFISVLDCLLHGKNKPENAASPKRVQQELRLIQASEGIAESNILDQQMDFSQFKIRGKYTQSETLGRYFQAMMYAGIGLFPVQPSQATGIDVQQADLLTRQALQLSRLIMTNKELKALYTKISAKLEWMFGIREDLSVTDYYQVENETDENDIAKIREQLIAYATENGLQPQIISGAVNTSQLEEGITASDAMTGWRLFPQRFTPDSAAFQYLVFDHVTDYLGLESPRPGNSQPMSLVVINGRKVRGFPGGLELMALLGSRQAERMLDAMDERNYNGYPAAAWKARKQLAQPAGLPSQNIQLMQYWLTRGEESQAEELRRLNSCLAFWTYSRYINVLYAKQSYTMLGKSGVIKPKDSRTSAWLEPAPELYVYLQQNVSQLHRRLPSDRLISFMDILQRCRDIALKEIQMVPLSRDDIDFLNNLDTQLLPLTGGKDSPVIVDVHTEPNSKQVLEEGIGFANVVSGKKQSRGALFTYYEFLYPMKNRLTNERWEQMLKKGDHPFLPFPFMDSR